jgi:chemotaxis protein methyltransferase CheR
LKSLLIEGNHSAELENIEVDLLLDGIYRRYGHDLRNYARASIQRRIQSFSETSGCNTISELIPKLLHDPTCFERFLHECSITVTEMFRDPQAFQSIRQQVVPYLKTHPHVRVWHAGCATGEEAYSLAILLKEEALFERATIFATDFNDIALHKARQGIYSIDDIKTYTSNYQQAGGSDSFADYYHAHYNSIAINNTLKENITFANHNLATDSVFSETHLILCRNVLIYFNAELQNRVLSLFCDSLVHGGFLCLGSKESLLFTDVKEQFKEIDKKWRIYQKTGT